MIDRAMDTHRNLDRLFWLDSTASLISKHETEHHTDLVRNALRRILAAFAIPYSERLASVRFLAEQVIPLV